MIPDIMLWLLPFLLTCNGSKYWLEPVRKKIFLDLRRKPSHAPRQSRPHMVGGGGAIIEESDNVELNQHNSSFKMIADAKNDSYYSNQDVETATQNLQNLRNRSTSILGKAVLATPHRRMIAVKIMISPRPPRSSRQHTPPLAVTTIFITKFTLAHELNCALRDLRIIDPKIPPQGTTFLARPNGIVINVGHVRAVIMRDCVWILPPEEEGPLVNEVIDALVPHLNWMLAGSTASELYSSGKSRKRGSTGVNDLEPAPAFEMLVLDALLGHVCSIEAQKAEDILKRVDDVLSVFGLEHFSSNGESPLNRKRKKESFLKTEKILGELLPLKNRVDQLEASFAEFVSAIEDVLKSDENMNAMCLPLRQKVLAPSPQPSSAQHQQVEVLFEDYLMQMEEVLHSLRTMQSSIKNTEEVVEIELDLVRNRMMRYEIVLEMVGLVVGCGAAITGLFGMNLVNHYEVHSTMFLQVSAFICIMMLLMGIVIKAQLVRDNIF